MKKSVKVLVVGGTFGNEPKKSSVISILADQLRSEFSTVKVVNGGSVQDLETTRLKGYDLTLWMPNVSNEVEKAYPKKDVGSVLICSKVLHDDRTVGDAVSRIFKMHANAVVAIRKDEVFSFELIDALGNVWINTETIATLAEAIVRLYEWSSSSVRVKSVLNSALPIHEKTQELSDLCYIVRTVADKVENERGGRYFGNASTRCEKLFPSAKDKDIALVSARNVSKNRITESDFVTVQMSDNFLSFNAKEAKPSVDSAVQMRIMEYFPDVKYMIHGHAYILGAPMTKHYFPCGDLREVAEIAEWFSAGCRILNLKNHGFLIAANSLSDLAKIAESLHFMFREIGKEEANW